jgi:hypothetical protein
MGSAAGARLVPAKEGEGQSGLSAEGCGGLQERSGAFAGGGLVWCRGDQARVASAASVSLRSCRGQKGQTSKEGGRGAALGRLGQTGSLPGQLSL